MRLLVISDAPILEIKSDKQAYAPYVREMDLWMKYVDHTTFICPTFYYKSLLTQSFAKQEFVIKSLRRLEFNTFLSAFISLLTVPYQFIVLCFAFAKADHIHLRCPGNLALLASIVQIFFPSKRKTAKYAGNFDPNAMQPIAYKWQRRILSNTFLTKSIDVLVYGKWPDQTKNVKSFFTATYSREQIVPVYERDWNGPYKAVFVGTMGVNKRPLEVFEIIHKLIINGIDISIDFYGDGPLKNEIESKLMDFELNDKVRLHGNVDNSIVTEAYKIAHFSFLLSQSEGWPKAVAEAMFWGCIPVASQVSCVPWMLHVNPSGSKSVVSSSASRERSQDDKATTSSIERHSLNSVQSLPKRTEKGVDTHQRGILINDISMTEKVVTDYLSQPDLLQELSQNAASWSRHYTLDDFEEAIQELLKADNS